MPKYCRFSRSRKNCSIRPAGESAPVGSRLVKGMAGCGRKQAREERGFGVHLRQSDMLREATDPLEIDGGVPAGALPRGRSSLYVGSHSCILAARTVNDLR